MWNEHMNGVMNSLVTQIESTFEPVDLKEQEIYTWFEQVHAKVDAADFQLTKNEPMDSSAARKKRTAKNVKKEKNTLPEEASPFDSILTESGHNVTKPKRASRATKRSTTIAKINVKSENDCDSTFVIPTRSSRAASKAAVSKINSQLNISLTKKLRRPSSTNGSDSFAFLPPLSSTIVLHKKEEPNFGSPGPSVKEQVQAFEKLNAHDSTDAESSQDENAPKTPKTPFQPVRMTRSKAITKSRKSGGLGSKTVVLKKPGLAFVKVKRLSNSGSKILRLSGPSEKEKDKEVKNLIVAPTTKITATQLSTEDAIKKKKEELLRKQEKEDEARRKKEEALKAHAEEAKRKREEKRAKAAAIREAAEKLKQEAVLKAEKEKEERKKMQLEREEKQKEEHAKKRNLTAQKAAETEERRRQEEAARQARLREVAEEQKRAAALKLREHEENAAMKRKLEEAKQAKKLGKEPKKEVAEYKCTPTKDERPLKKPKTEEDYGLEDASASDSSEDESNPKKEIPRWAHPSNRNPQLLNQIYYPAHDIHQFMSCKKEVDLTQIFKTSEVRIRSRTSSAIWTSPLSTTFCRK